MAGPQVVVDVHATGCHGLDGRPLPRDEAVDRPAQAVWQSLELPVDAVHLTVSDAESLDSLPVITGRDDLVERFGPSAAGVVWPIPRTARTKASGSCCPSPTSSLGSRWSFWLVASGALA